MLYYEYMFHYYDFGNSKLDMDKDLDDFLMLIIGSIDSVTEFMYKRHVMCITELMNYILDSNK